MTSPSHARPSHAAFDRYAYYNRHHIQSLNDHRKLRYLTAVVTLKYCDERVCLSVCPLACLENHTSATSRNFLYVLNAAVTRISSDHNALRYVVPVLWMTSCLPIIGRAKATPVASILKVIHQETARGRSLMHRIALLLTEVLKLGGVATFCQKLAVRRTGKGTWHIKPLNFEYFSSLLHFTLESPHSRSHLPL